MAISKATGISLSVSAPSGATDAARNTTQGAQQTDAGAVALGKGSTLTTIAAGASNVTGRGNKSNVVEYGGKGNDFNVVNNDPATAQLAITATSTLADKFASSLSDYAAKSGATLSDILSKGQDTQGKTYEALAALAANQQNNSAQAATQQLASSDATAASADTGGLSRFQKTFLILGLAAIGVAAIFFWKRK